MLAKNASSGKYKIIAQTEFISNDRNPVFQSKLVAPLEQLSKLVGGDRGEIKFNVYNIGQDSASSGKLTTKNLIGECATNLATLQSQATISLPLMHKSNVNSQQAFERKKSLVQLKIRVLTEAEQNA